MPACQAAYIAYVFQSRCEHHDRKRASHLIFTKVEEVNALLAHLNSEYLSGDALGFAHVLAGFVNGDAIGGVEAGRGTEREERDQRESPGVQLRSRNRALPGRTGEGARPHMSNFSLRAESQHVLDFKNNGGTESVMGRQIIRRVVPEWN